MDTTAQVSPLTMYNSLMKTNHDYGNFRNNTIIYILIAIIIIFLIVILYLIKKITDSNKKAVESFNQRYERPLILIGANAREPHYPMAPQIQTYTHPQLEYSRQNYQFTNNRTPIIEEIY